MVLIFFVVFLFCILALTWHCVLDALWFLWWCVGLFLPPVPLLLRVSVLLGRLCFTYY